MLWVSACDATSWQCAACSVRQPRCMLQQYSVAAEELECVFPTKSAGGLVRRGSPSPRHLGARGHGSNGRVV